LRIENRSCTVGITESKTHSCLGILP
jgi:hypothetical protein